METQKPETPKEAFPIALMIENTTDIAQKVVLFDAATNINEDNFGNPKGVNIIPMMENITYQQILGSLINKKVSISKSHVVLEEEDTEKYIQIHSYNIFSQSISIPVFYKTKTNQKASILESDFPIKLDSATSLKIDIGPKEKLKVFLFPNYESDYGIYRRRDKSFNSAWGPIILKVKNPLLEAQEFILFSQDEQKVQIESGYAEPKYKAIKNLLISNPLTVSCMRIIGIDKIDSISILNKGQSKYHFEACPNPQWKEINKNWIVQTMMGTEKGLEIDFEPFILNLDENIQIKMVAPPQSEFYIYLMAS